MKIALVRGPGRYGGIFRRFRALCAYAAGRHDVIGVLLLGHSDAPFADPVRTLSYDRRHVSWRVLRAERVDDVLDACAPLIVRVSSDLVREGAERVLAVDTDLKAVVAIAAARRAGIPVATFVSGFAAEEARCEGARRLPFVELAEQYCLQSSDALIFPSRFAAEHAAGRVPRPAPGIVIHNGIADAFRTAARPDAQVDPRRVGAVMRLSPVKNPEALGRIQTALGGHGFGLDVVTDGDRRGPSLGRARLLAPTLDDRALASRYAGWRAVVCPSRFEASGNVAMEAIAVGTPPVVTDRMGIAEILRDVGLGYLVVAVDDIDAAVARLVEACPVPAAVRDHVRATFAWPAVSARIVNALQEAA